MKNTLRGTLTEENLLKAFAGESQARNRYTYFASQAKKDGYEQIAAVFATTADQAQLRKDTRYQTLSSVRQSSESEHQCRNSS